MDVLFQIPQVFAGNVIPALIVLTAVVFVHEMGHFLVARWCGIRVAAFSIGFGRELFGFTDRRGTRWKLSAIPLGGYVRFEGDDNAASMPDEEKLAAIPPAERKGLFYFAPLWKRVAVVAAGPVANFVLAILVFSAVFITIGRPYVEPVIGVVDAGSPADLAGIRPGDKVLSVNAHTIESFTDLDQFLMGSRDSTLTIVVERNGETRVLTASPQWKEITDLIGRSQRVLVLGAQPQIPAIVGGIEKDSAADTAGLEPGDRVSSIDGRVVESFSDLQAIVAGSAGKTLSITIDRQGREIVFSATPREKWVPDGADGLQLNRVLGIKSAPSEFRRDDPVTALVEAGRHTWEIIARTLDYLGHLVVGQESPTQMSGIIGIGQVSGAVAENGGIGGLIFLTAVLSISIGLFNLFPVPMLDGGHLFFYLIEAVRGRPLSPRVQDLGFRIGFALVIMLFIFVTFNDIANISGMFVNS